MNPSGEGNSQYCLLPGPALNAWLRVSRIWLLKAETDKKMATHTSLHNSLDELLTSQVEPKSDGIKKYTI